MTDDPLVTLALRFTDGESIDWKAELESGSVDLALLQNLKQIEAVARAHDSTDTLNVKDLGPAIVGARFWGHLEIIELIGSGSYGDVYRARDTRLGRDVALKLLRTRDAIKPNSTSLVREGHLLSRVRHPNVVTVHGADCLNGQTGLWMELIEGETLEQEVRRRAAFEAQEVAQIGAVLCDALEAVHSAGLVHRDVKAQNVMRDRTDRLVLMDFGSVHDAQRFASLTVEGTPLYAAPEVLNGASPSVRSDIYSLGVLLWYLLTTTYPVNGRSVAEIRRAHTCGRIAKPEEIEGGGDVARIAAECLVIDARRRPTAVELGNRLRECAQPSGSRRRSIRNASALGVFAATVLLVATVPLRLSFKAEAASASATGESVVPITANPVDRTLTSAHISPDGRYLAYADSTGVHVRVIDTGETHELAETKNMNVYGWKADSDSLLASLCDVQCVGWVIPLLGQERRRAEATWPKEDSVKVAPDGQRILRRHRFKPLIVDPMNGGPEIRLSDGFVNAANWSPDGKRIVFVKNASHVETVSAEGGVPREVFRAPANRLVWDVLELSDGSILIAIGPPNDTAVVSSAFELWKLRTDRNEVSRKTSLSLGQINAWVSGLTASADGQRIAFLSNSFQTDVYVSDCDLRRGVLQTPRRLTVDDRADTSWAWMPDSSAVLFSSNRNGAEKIFMQRLDTEIAEPLVTAPEHQDMARVTSDGQWLLYREVSRSAPHTERIMRVPVAGGVPEFVHNLGTVGDYMRRGFHCAAHGRCIVYDSQNRTLILSTLDPIEGIGRELGRIPESTRGAYVLPDGDSYAYIPADKGIQNRVRIVSFIGAPPKDIFVQHATALNNLVWLPSNSGFLTTDNGNLLLVSQDGSSRVLWSPGPLTVYWAEASPDEKHVAIQVGSTQRNAWMLSGF